MNKIEVGVIAEHGKATEMMCFLARLTQRGHGIKTMHDIYELMEKPASSSLAESMMKQELHGTIKRFTPITIAIVGASRRFLAQARTNQVGFNYVSASLQYSDYTGSASFVIPYTLMEASKRDNTDYACEYLQDCERAMEAYRGIVSIADNDTAGYVAPQGLRNILVQQGNHEAWLHFIKTRTCNRNTNETQYVALRIWEELLKTDGGQEMFKFAGPDCLYGMCREGKMCCKDPMRKYGKIAKEQGITIPRAIINEQWPLLGGWVNA